jgi:hypothetical protein
MGEAGGMHWKVKALSGVLAINLALLLSIGTWLLVNRPADEEEAKPVPPPPAPIPEEVPPLPAPEEVSADQ